MQKKSLFAYVPALIFIFASSVSASTWVNGSNNMNQWGSYGTIGIRAPENLPSARSYCVSFKDSLNNFWLFGGLGYDESGINGLLNDLWKWDGSQWTWIKGSNLVDRYGIYGTKGQAGSNNNPGARDSSVSWTDNSGNFWLFGGYGFGSAGSFNLLNDLWRFDGTNWSWISGSNIVSQNGVYGTKGQPASSNVPGSRYSSISWIDASGFFWLFGGYGLAASGTSPGYLNDLWKWDGTNWTWMGGSNLRNQYGVYDEKGTPASGNVPGARAYSISWTDSDGNFWLFGGTGYYDSGSAGYLNDLWKFDGENWTWVSGANFKNQTGMYGTRETPSADNVPGARESSAACIDGAGNFYLFGGYGLDSSQTEGYLNDLWKFDGSNWTWIAGSQFVNQNGTYGSINLPAPENIPGARDGSICWLDANDNICILGGHGLGSSGSTIGLFNDLWQLAAGVAPPEPPQPNYVVGAYYYPWYSNNNFHGGPSTTLINHLDPPMMPQLGWYNQTDPSVISQHFKWARYAGISFFVTSYWGAGSNEDYITQNYMFDNPDRGSIKLAALYETDAITISNVASETTYLCDNYFNRTGYFRIDGKPVIFIYVTRDLQKFDYPTLEAYINAIRNAAANKGLQLYIVGDEVWGSPDTAAETPRVNLMDAVTNYDVYGNLGMSMHVNDSILESWQANNSTWKNFVNERGKQFIPGVAPGFNDTAVLPPRGHNPSSRKLNTEGTEFGSLFSAMLEKAKPSIDSKKMLMVTSWNEWHEDTQIEPVKFALPTSYDDSGAAYAYTQGLNYNGYGMLYLQILRTKMTPLALCDFDNDGSVNFDDLAVICAENWLHSCDVTGNCWGDINNSGLVSFADFAQCTESWGKSVALPSTSCDFDNDGKTSFDDFAYLLDYWLVTCGADADCLRADLSSNNLINFADFSVCAQSWSGQ